MALPFWLIQNVIDRRGASQNYRYVLEILDFLEEGEFRRYSQDLSPCGFPGASGIALGRIQHRVSGKRSQHG